jgi:hypothetical protein|tara:strand:- start:2 stop:388 length:387 start_codon:yes stop_codon:yes gene_type:complete
MKKLLGIIILSLVFYVNPLTISDSNAGWFSDPMEKCMDRVLKFSFDNDKEKTANAAAYCKSASSSSLKCMDRVLKFSFANNKKKSASAAVLCGGSTSSSLKCMDRVLKDSFNNDKKKMANAAAVCAKK